MRVAEVGTLLLTQAIKDRVCSDNPYAAEGVVLSVRLLRTCIRLATDDSRDVGRGDYTRQSLGA